ncbi:MAG TPA: hypothetical protein VL173_11810, partial [Vicinamibacterales bacterium]|nr:hypothetical protein [Vicinamibacterales bacterium]
LLQAIDAVAGVLGNTRAVCRRSYIHPAVVDAYMNGSLPRVLRQGARRSPHALRAEEMMVVRLLEQRLTKAA